MHLKQAVLGTINPPWQETTETWILNQHRKCPTTPLLPFPRQRLGFLLVLYKPQATRVNPAGLGALPVSRTRPRPRGLPGLPGGARGAGRGGGFPRAPRRRPTCWAAPPGAARLGPGGSPYSPTARGERAARPSATRRIPQTEIERGPARPNPGEGEPGTARPCPLPACRRRRPPPPSAAACCGRPPRRPRRAWAAPAPAPASRRGRTPRRRRPGAAAVAAAAAGAGRPPPSAPPEPRPPPAAIAPLCHRGAWRCRRSGSSRRRRRRAASPAPRPEQQRARRAPTHRSASVTGSAAAGEGPEPLGNLRKHRRSSATPVRKPSAAVAAAPGGAGRGGGGARGGAGAGLRAPRSRAGRQEMAARLPLLGLADRCGAAPSPPPAGPCGRPRWVQDPRRDCGGHVGRRGTEPWGRAGSLLTVRLGPGRAGAGLPFSVRFPQRLHKEQRRIWGDGYWLDPPLWEHPAAEDVLPSSLAPYPCSAQSCITQCIVFFPAFPRPPPCTSQRHSTSDFSRKGLL